MARTVDAGALAAGCSKAPGSLAAGAAAFLSAKRTAASR